MTDYEKICVESRNLTGEEQAEVLRYIQNIQNGKGGRKEERQTVDSEKLPRCPHCGGESVIRFGHKRGKQRFYCKDCDKVFMSSTRTLMENSRCDEGEWRSVVADTLESTISIDKTAEKLGLSHQTVFHMRHKILMSLQARQAASPTILKEIAELDETYVLENQKGRKMSPDAPRQPRKHGEKATRDGVSNEQICIMTGVQRNGGPAYAVTLNRAHPSAAEMKRAFQGHLSGCVAFTDGLKGYKRLEEVADCVIESVNRQEQKKSRTANLNNVNNFHSYIHERYSHYRGVATQYINRYNALFSVVYRAKESLSELADTILLGVRSHIFSYREIHHAFLTII